MTHNSSVAANLKPKERKKLFLEMQSSDQTISAIANREGVSRKFLHQQHKRGHKALEKEFNQSKQDTDILYWIPVTKEWIFQVILALIFICHSSYRGVVEFLRDLFDYPISVGTVHNKVSSMIETAQKINKSQDLSGIKVGLKDEIFQSGLPVLTGIDAFSTYCYLLVGAEHRDEDTWGWHLLEASEQGLNPDFSIADAGKGLRAGHEAAWPGKPCHGDTFHILHKCEGLENYLNRRAKALTGQREKLELKMEKAKTKGQGNRWSTKLTNARRAEKKAITLAKDVSILCDWLKQDVKRVSRTQLDRESRIMGFYRG